MNRRVIFTVMYAILVIINGLMSFSYYDTLSALFFEAVAGIALLLSLYFRSKNKKVSRYLLFSIGLILLFFYGYSFSTTTSFHTGLMTIISAFFVFSQLIEIINITKKT